MIRQFFLAAALAAGAASIAAPRASQAQLVTGVLNLTGDYNITATGDSMLNGKMHLRQSQYTVVGYLDTADGSRVQVNGKLNNQTLSGKWRGPTGEVGWLTMNFLTTGRSFNGEYGYGGRKPNGEIAGRRLTATHM
jgi:hypothetical protein